MLICIAREFGSGGHEIGKRLAEILGFQFYDQALVTKAISRSSISSEILEKVDEKKENSWLHSVVYDAADQNLRGISANEAMFRMQSAVILEAAQKESCVFVGRCADDVLKKAGVDRLSLFITAPFTDRVKRKTKLLGKDEKTVTALIRKMDKQRKNYYNYYTGSNWGKPYHYDLCINSSTLGIERTAEALAVFSRQIG
jgi:cytidylate kinase